MLTKSDYLLFLKHPAWLWLKTNAKEKLPPPDPGLERIFSRGHDFETYAESLFPDGIKLGFNNFNEYESLPERTTTALTNGAKTLFQARFATQTTTCITDIVNRIEGNTFDLIEVKSSTKAKPEHIPDLAFQTIVLEQCGYTIRSISIMHVNSNFVREGTIYPDQLVTRTDVTTEVRAAIPDTSILIKQALRTASEPSMPDISPRYANSAALKDWLKIYLHLNPQLDTSSIYHLAGRSIKQIAELEDSKITLIKDIPDDFKLTTKQQRQVTATKTNQPYINKKQIKSFIDDFTYPLYFLDYETLGDIIPPFDGLHPFQQAPFQYSLHKLETPDSDLQHVGYLHPENTNPIIPLTQALQSQIGTTGTILVWYEDFERSRNTEMGTFSPEFQEFYQQLNDRIVDLMIPFASGWYTHKDFLGSASIKKVLPALVPELSYQDLEIHEGNAAQRLWMETILEGKHMEEKDKILHDLDKYCELDTLAMVRIYQKLLEVS